MFGDLEILDHLYKALCQNDEFMKLLGSPKTPVERNERIRRELTPLKFATSDKLNFISMYFSSAIETDNIYVVRGFLNVDFFTANREQLRPIQRLVNCIFEENFLLRVSFRNEASFSKGVFCYTEKYRPLIFA